MLITFRIYFLASLRSVREVFDKLDNDVTRAFYIASNYVLVDEMFALDRGDLTFFVVDRFYSSSCSYTVGEAVVGGVDKILELDNSWFDWPQDLLKPELIILLEVDYSIRNSRISKRCTAASAGNPWDERLQLNPDMAERIMAGLNMCLCNR